MNKEIVKKIFDKSRVIRIIKKVPIIPNDNEIQEIRFYFKTVIGNVYKKRGLKSGTQLFINKKEYSYTLNHQGQLLNEEEFINVLFMELFSNGGWLEKHQDEFKDLSDDEVWKKTNNRAYKLLRDSIPKSYMEEICEECEPGEKIIGDSRQHGDMKTTTFDEFGNVKSVKMKKAKPIRVIPSRQYQKSQVPVNKIEIGYEGTIPDKIGDDGKVVTGIMAAEEKAVNPLEIFGRSHKPVAVKIKESMDKIIDKIIKADKEAPTFPEFLNNLKDKFYNHPEIFIKQLRNKYKDQPLISRYLVNTFPSEESFRAIYNTRETFLKELFFKYSSKWEKVLARIAVKAEARKKLRSGMSGKGKIAATQEMLEFYRTWIPGLRREHLFMYAKSEIKKKPEDLNKMLQNFAHIIYEDLLKKGQEAT